MPQEKQKKVIKCTINVDDIPDDYERVNCTLCGDSNTTKYAIQFSKLFLRYVFYLTFLYLYKECPTKYTTKIMN